MPSTDASLIRASSSASTDKGYEIYKELRLLKGQIWEFHFQDAGFLLGQGQIDFAKSGRDQ